MSRKYALDASDKSCVIQLREYTYLNIPANYRCPVLETESRRAITDMIDHLVDLWIPHAISHLDILKCYLTVIFFSFFFYMLCIYSCK